MHIPAIRIRNIRSLHSHEWSVPREKCAGWHVILGDNGSGKSSFLRAIALALTEPRHAGQLRQSWNDWLTRSRRDGHIRLQVAPRAGCDGLTAPGVEQAFGLGIRLVRRGAAVERSVSPKPPSKVGWTHDRGWFAASFGPFRRFFGGNASLSKSLGSAPRVGRHLSMFEEGIALTECLEWLRELKFRELEDDPEGVLLHHVMEFVNQGDFLPSNVRLEDVTSRGILFRDANGVDVSVGDLSDGYRSILSLTFELIRQMAKAFGPERVFEPTDATRILREGVVIIDEVDAHLHPTWQRRVGRWFCEHFPNVQFIVSTHSPLVCQSAEKGSIYVLPRSGSDEKGRMVEGAALKRLVYGTVLDAYGTEAFGREAALTRSSSSRHMHKRLATLNNTEIRRRLTDEEEEERRKLREALPSAATTLGEPC